MLDSNFQTDTDAAAKDICNGNIITTLQQENLNNNSSDIPACQITISRIEPCRKRRKLPAIPPDKKPFERLCQLPKQSLAQELIDSEEWKNNAESTNFNSMGPYVIHQVSKNLYLEIDTSGRDLKPCLRYFNKESSQHDDCTSDHFHESGRLSVDVDSGNSSVHTPDGGKSISPSIQETSLRSSSCILTPSISHLQLQDATHRGLHKFLPRHIDEFEIEIGDPIYVYREAEDFWFEGLNLRTGQTGIFPSAYVTDVNYDDLGNDGGKKRERYLVDFLGSIEVASHKGNDVLCQAVRKVAKANSVDPKIVTPHPCILEINDHGLRMVNRKKPVPNTNVPSHDYFFNLKNVTFCGYHPQDHRYFGFVTKHPLKHKFACHVFIGEDSTREVAEAVGRAFQRFYQKFIDTIYPTEDIYLE